MHTLNKCYQVIAAMYIMPQPFTRTFKNTLVERIPQVIEHVNNSNRLVLLNDQVIKCGAVWIRHWNRS